MADVSIRTMPTGSSWPMKSVKALKISTRVSDRGLNFSRGLHELEGPSDTETRYAFADVSLTCSSSKTAVASGLRS